MCSALSFPPLEISDHIVVSAYFDFPLNSKQNVPFHSIAFDYFSISNDCTQMVSFQINVFMRHPPSFLNDIWYSFLSRQDVLVPSYV